VTRPPLHAETTGGATVAERVGPGRPVEEQAAGSPHPDGPPPTAGRARPARVTAWLVAAAIVVPLALFTWRALHAPINFDGGMNLQVAEHLAKGQGYVRFYDRPLQFPQEVQTNGPYMWLAAGVIGVLGPGQLAYQLPNLLFVAGFLAVVSFMLRREPLPVRMAGPALVLLAAPMIATYALGGLGEVPMTFLLLCSLAALVEGVRAPRRAPWWALGAALAFGAGLATKTVAIGAAGAVAVGLVCVLVAATTWRQRGLVVLASLGALLVPVARELQRLAALGSVAAYRAWWSDQRGSISTQSGVKSSDTRGLRQAFLDHMHVLSGFVDVPAALLLGVVFLPLALAAGVLAWRWRTRGLRATLSDPAMVLLLVVAVFTASYFLWWLLLVPDNKAWIRRILPGLLGLHLLYLLLVTWVVRLVRAVRAPAGSGGGTHRPRSALGIAGAGLALAVVVAGVPYGAFRAGASAVDLGRAEQAWLDANREAAAYIRAHPEQRYYGDEWWSAPVLSLMSHRGFYNLGDADVCSLDPARDRLVWDHYAMTIRSRLPWTRGDKLAYRLVERFGSDVEIYSVGPGPGHCT
jgi:hypothetical protein